MYVNESNSSFAENDNEIENNENIIDTSSLTDENVLYKAIQEKNGFSLFGLDDSNDEGITTDFDVVMDLICHILCMNMT